MCDRFRKSPTATLHNYWTFTSHMFIVVSFSSTLDVDNFGASRSLSFAECLPSMCACVCIASQMSVLLQQILCMVGCYSFFFFLFVLMSMLLNSIIIIFFSWFFCSPDKRANRPSQPVSQLGSHLTIKILWVAYCTHSESSTAVNGLLHVTKWLWISFLKAHTPFYYILLSRLEKLNAKAKQQKNCAHVHLNEIKN